MDLSKIMDSGRTNLLITTVGKRSLKTCSNWISKRSSFDVIFIYYDKDFVPDFMNLPDILIIQIGFKYPSLYKIFKQYPNLLDKYNFYFLPDDDVEISSHEIELLFKFAQENKIAICQPSIYPINYTWKITLNNPYTTFRYVSIVEVMCPMFSKEALEICLPSFNESQSGWGLEPAWKKLLNNNIYKFAILDQVIALHTHPVDFQNGFLYKALLEHEINPQEELSRMCEKYNSNAELVNIDFNYKSFFHQNLYTYLQNLNIQIFSSEIKVICLIYLHFHLIKIILSLFPEYKKELFKFYSSHYEGEITSEFSSFFKKNKKKFKLILRAMGNSTDQELRDLCMSEEWNLLCKNQINEIDKSIINVKSMIDDFMREITFFMKTHLHLSDYFLKLLFYLISQLPNEIIDLDYKSDD